MNCAFWLCWSHDESSCVAGEGGRGRVTVPTLCHQGHCCSRGSGVGLSLFIPKPRVSPFLHITSLPRGPVPWSLPYQMPRWSLSWGTFVDTLSYRKHSELRPARALVPCGSVPWGCQGQDPVLEAMGLPGSQTPKRGGLLHPSLCLPHHCSTCVCFPGSGWTAGKGGPAVFKMDVGL